MSIAPWWCAIIAIANAESAPLAAVSAASIRWCIIVMHGCTAAAKASLLFSPEYPPDFALVTDASAGQAGGVKDWARALTTKRHDTSIAISIKFHKLRRLSDVKIAIMLPPFVLLRVAQRLERLAKF
jgi:hypothetical protein